MQNLIDFFKTNSHLLPITYQKIIDGGNMSRNKIAIRKVASKFYNSKLKTVIIAPKPISKIYLPIKRDDKS
jgi:hypothetical protein